MRVCQTVGSFPSEQPIVSIFIGRGTLLGCQSAGTTGLAGN